MVRQSLFCAIVLVGEVIWLCFSLNGDKLVLPRTLHSCLHLVRTQPNHVQTTCMLCSCFYREGMWNRGTYVLPHPLTAYRNKATVHHAASAPHCTVTHLKIVAILTTSASFEEAWALPEHASSYVCSKLPASEALDIAVHKHMSMRCTHNSYQDCDNATYTSTMSKDTEVIYTLI